MSKLDYIKDHDQKLVLAMEQLEVCADLIKTKNPIKARLAIILLDNLVDILMYRYCSPKFQFEKTYVSVMKPTFSEKEVLDAQHSIDGKIKVLKKMGAITEKQETIISICHSYRNDAQHRDEHNPSINILFAKILFEIVCNFFVKSQDKGHSAYFIDTPEWAKKYISGNHVDYEKFSKTVVSKIKKGLGVKLDQVRKILSKDIQKRIDCIESMLKDDLPEMNKKEFDYMLKRYQFENTDDFKNISKGFYEIRYSIVDGTAVREQVDKNLINIQDQMQSKLETFQANINYSTYEKIKKAPSKIANSKTISNCLKIYQRFNYPLEDLELYIYRAMEEWDEYQQLMLDIARGK